MQEFFTGLLTVLNYMSDYTAPFMAVCAFLSYVIKPVRCRIVKAVKKISNSEEISAKIDTLLASEHKISEQLKVHDKIHLSALKNRITNLYFKYINSDCLPSFEKQNLAEHYELYKKLGGNGYVDTLYEALMRKRERIHEN